MRTGGFLLLFLVVAGLIKQVNIMIKTMVAVIMLSVSSLTYADKFEYAELEYSSTRGGDSYYFVSPTWHVSSSGGSRIDGYNEIASQLGWAKKTRASHRIHITDFLNPLGADGWELVSTVARQITVTLYIERYLLKRRIK